MQSLLKTVSFGQKLQKLPSSKVRSIGFLGRGGNSKKSVQKTEEQQTLEEKRVKSEFDESLTVSLNRLASKSSLTTKRPYKPPIDVKEKIQNLALAVVHGHVDDWLSVSLEDPLIKYKLLSQLVKVFNHDVPNCELTKMTALSDAVAFFETEVRQTSAFEDISKLDLPKNVHIQCEYNRFDPDTDTLNGGRTAFPGSDSVVSSIKYRRKYKSVKTSVDKPGFVNQYYYGY